MPKQIPQEVQKLRSMPLLGLGEAAEGFETVKGFLERFGYLAQPQQAPDRRSRAPRRSASLDESTSMALLKYQAMHTLPLSGQFDELTRSMMSRARCGFPDIDPATGVAFSTTCAWGKDNLTFAFDAATNDVGGDEEFNAVRRAFATWSAAVQIAFREVGTGDSPDILISWTPANCGDTSMVGGVLAHADYPPGCGFYGNALPRPLHFDDQEHAWCIGTVADQYDVETIALHEIGHLLGLSHSSVAGAVMFPTVSANATNRVLTADDVEGIRRLYPIRGPVFVRHSGHCLDIEGISLDNGADATQWDYWGGQNQIFRIEWVEGSHYPSDRATQRTGHRRGRDLHGQRGADPPVGLVGRRQSKIPPRPSRARLLPRRRKAQRQVSRRRRNQRRQRRKSAPVGLVGRQQSAMEARSRANRFAALR
jgi:Matrixin